MKTAHRVQYSMTDDGWNKATVDSKVVYTKLYFRYVRSGNSNDWDALEKYGNTIKNGPNTSICLTGKTKKTFYGGEKMILIRQNI